jgi:regulator of nonsense transcripts 1
MESFENFNDANSQYGPIDDTASMVSGYTTTNTAKTQEDALDLTSLSLSDKLGTKDEDAKFSVVDEDFDGVLEDIKDNDALNLPPHACR